MEPTTIEEWAVKRAKRGSDWLMEHSDRVRGGEDWPREIDLDRLDLWSPENCIIGQVWITDGADGWTWSTWRKEFVELEPADYGFDSFDSRDKAAMEGAWEELIETWRSEHPL